MSVLQVVRNGGLSGLLMIDDLVSESMALPAMVSSNTAERAASTVV